MKNSTLKNISLLINIFVIVVFLLSGFPLWTFLFLIPVNVYLQIYASQQYTFRNSLQIEEIPQIGYEKRIAELNGFDQRLQSLGFEKFDEFYLKTSTDIIGFAYRHSELPIILCNYHFEVLMMVDLDTKFENGYALTTCNSKTSSINEIRAPHQYIQAFPDADVEELFNRHIQSVRYLQMQGFNTLSKPIYNFRQNFLDEFLAAGEKAKSLAAPVKLLYLMYFGNKNRFTKTIQEQVLAKHLQLPQ